MKSRLPESLRRERDMIDRVNQGIGRCDKLGRGEAFIASDRLRPEQKGAVGFVLGSRDRVVAISGAAGTGKTATPQELRRGLAEAGREVVAIAPTMSAVEELQKVGFGYAMTVARLLQDPAGQQQVRRKVLILDEARMVSGRQMAEFLRLAELNDARVVFTDRGAAPDAERLPRRDSGAAACAGARFREAGCDGLGPRSNDSRTCAGSRSGVWRGAV
jgi:Mrp family chromosome partitioning ATPase